MRTGRSLTGVYLPGPGGVYLPGPGGVYLPGPRGGVPAWSGGVYLPGPGGGGGCTCLVPGGCTCLVRGGEGGTCLVPGGRAWSGTPPTVNRMTHRCKNITLAKTSFRPVINITRILCSCRPSKITSLSLIHTPYLLLRLRLRYFDLFCCLM